MWDKQKCNIEITMTLGDQIFPIYDGPCIYKTKRKRKKIIKNILSKGAKK